MQQGCHPELLCVQAHSLSVEHVPVHVYVCNIQDHHSKVDLFPGLHMFVMYVLGKGHVHRPLHICKEGLKYAMTELIPHVKSLLKLTIQLAAIPCFYFIVEDSLSWSGDKEVGFL